MKMFGFTFNFDFLQAEYTEYHRYLKEVVQALESDPDFRERLEKADEEDVRVRCYVLSSTKDYCLEKKN